MKAAQIIETGIYLLIIMVCVTIAALLVLSPPTFMDATAVYQGF
jgi:hypothetical protein